MSKILRLFIFFLPLLTLGAGFYFVKDFLTIKRVIIISPETKVYGIGDIRNTSYLFIDARRLETVLLEKNPLAHNIIVKKQYPNLLEIYFTFRTPSALIYKGPFVGIVDSSGVLLEGDPKMLTNLPKIFISDIPLYTSTTPDWRITKALKIVTLLSQEGLIVEKIHIDNIYSYYKAFLKGGQITIIPQANDAKVMVASLQVIITRFRIEGKRLSVIDFRFSQPVVTQENGELKSPP